MEKFKNYRFFILSAILFFLVIAFLKFNKGKETDIQVTKGTIVEAVYGLATIQASNVFHLRIAVPAVITKSFVKQGDNVKKGTNLVSFDSFGIMKTPIDGVVTKFTYETGELVTPQSPILTVMDLKDRYLTVSLEEKAAVKVKPGQFVRIRFEALGNTIYPGSVESVYPTDGQFEVKVIAKDLPKELLPGMSADIAIETSKKENVLLVPAKSIQNGTIRLNRDGKITSTNIKTGISSGDTVEILEGDIKEGDFVKIP